MPDMLEPEGLYVGPPMLPPVKAGTHPLGDEVAGDEVAGSLSAYPPRQNAPGLSRVMEAALRNDLAKERRENQRLRDRIEAAEGRRRRQITVQSYEGVVLVQVFVPELDRVVTFWASQVDPRLRPPTLAEHEAAHPIEYLS